MTDAIRREQRLGWLAVLAGGVLALVVQVVAPVGVPLYDGVVVQEPYRFLHPTGDQAGSPLSFSSTPDVRGSTSPALVAATTENPPQAQLIAQDDAFELSPGATSLQVSVAPIEPPTPPADGAIAGNVYRFSVTDQAGTPLSIKPCDGCISLTLRAPEGTGTAWLMRFADGAWQEIETLHGMLGVYQTNPTALGDIAVIAEPEVVPGPDPLLLLGGAALVLLLGIGAFLFLRVQQAPRAPVPVMRASVPGRVPSKRKSGKRPPPPGRSKE